MTPPPIGSGRAVLTAAGEGDAGGIPASAVARYTFDDADTSGSTVVDVWNGNDGAINGATTGQPGVSTTYGSGESYSFDGIDDNVDLGPPDILPGLSEFTIAFWMDTDTDGSQGIYTTGNFETFIQTQSSGTLRFEVTTGNGDTQVNASGAYSTNTPVFLCCVYDGSSVIVYKNDANQVDSNSQSGTVSSDSGTRYIGTDTFNPFSGNLDDIRIYDKGLTPTEVSDLYNNGSI